MQHERQESWQVLVGARLPTSGEGGVLQPKRAEFWCGNLIRLIFKAEHL